MKNHKPCVSNRIKQLAEVSDARKEEVFHRFKRGQTTARGTSLGLYIVKTLVESFNGSVKLEDRVPGDSSKGSRFVVTLPATEK